MIVTELAIEAYGQRIGILRGATYRDFDLAIDPAAIERFGAYSTVLSLSVPLEPVATRGRAARRRNFFAGLQPEGRMLTAMAANARLQEFDTLGLLQRYGRDVAGAMQVWDVNDPTEPKEPAAEPVTPAQIRAMMFDRAAAPLGNAPARGKTSLAGIQPKIVLARTDVGWARVLDGYPSTHIVKPVVPDLPTMVFDEEYGSRFARTFVLKEQGRACQRATVERLLCRYGLPSNQAEGATSRALAPAESIATSL
jgi:serine/threonine-protein kinase HipA